MKKKYKNNIETRAFGCEFRVVRKEDEPVKITGHAAVFNRESENLGGFVEIIKPGAFKKALKGSDARALFNHDSNLILGRESAGTLSLREDKAGLYMEVELPDTQYARDLAVSMERGDITQQSFGFSIDEGGSMWEDDGERVLRTITDIKSVFDVSPVTYPAYPDTDAAVRAFDIFKKEQKSTGERTVVGNVQRRERQIKLKENELNQRG
jgi:HK97 family phage prohead protease